MAVKGEAAATRRDQPINASMDDRRRLISNDSVTRQTFPARLAG